MAHNTTKLALPLILVFALLTVAARVFGAAQTRDPILAGFTQDCTGKPQPCWYGIVPGVTSLQEVRAIMSHHAQAREIEPVTFNIAYRFSNRDQVFFNSLYNTYVDHMILKMDNHVSVGDILSTVGMPDRIFFRRTESPITYDVDYEQAQLTVILLDTAIGKLSPHEDISMLLDIRAQRPPAAGFQTYQWRGFAPHWKYCQMQPGPGSCSAS
jgi:hypothetical protein